MGARIAERVSRLSRRSERRKGTAERRKREWRRGSSFYFEPHGARTTDKCCRSRHANRSSIFLEVNCRIRPNLLRIERCGGFRECRLGAMRKCRNKLSGICWVNRKLEDVRAGRVLRSLYPLGRYGSATGNKAENEHWKSI